LQVDPFDVGALASALELLINNSNFRQQLSVKGLLQASKFDWRETARRTLGVYQDAVSMADRARAFGQGAAS
jgi:glycosyltransferase involved in cell wall biosynthesis